MRLWPPPFGIESKASVTEQTVKPEYTFSKNLPIARQALSTCRPEGPILQNGGVGVRWGLAAQLFEGLLGPHETQCILRIANHCRTEQRYRTQCQTLDTIPQKFQKSVTNTD